MPETSARLPALTNVERPRPAVVHLLEDRRAQRAGLAEEPGAAAGRHQRRQRGVERDVRVGVDHAEAVGADQPQPVGPGQPDQPALPAAPLVAGLGEAGGDHHQAVHALGGAVEHHLLHGVGGYGDHGDVDLARDVGDRLVGLEAGDRVGGGVHRVHHAGEVAGDEVADQRLADGVLAAAGADHRDRLGVEELGDRGRLGAVLAVLHHAQRGGGRVDGELEAHHAVLEAAGQLVARGPERGDHPLVVRQDLRDELVDALLAPRLGEVLEQDLGDAAAVVAVLDEERDLRLAALDPVVAADGDDLVGQQQHERDPVVVVDLGEPLHVPVGERRHRREEPEVLRLVAHPGVERDQPVGVLGADRPDVRRTPVEEEHVGGPVPRRLGSGRVRGPVLLDVGAAGCAHTLKSSLCWFPIRLGAPGSGGRSGRTPCRTAVRGSLQAPRAVRGTSSGTGRTPVRRTARRRRR